MVSIETARQLALSLPEAVEQEHWQHPSFRIKKKIFATLWPEEKRAVLKLPPIEQSVFCNYNNTIFYPVAGAWGRQGWTSVELNKVRKDMFKDALNIAWREVAPKKLLAKHTP